MKILIINKFLHPNGGSETYIFKLGEHLQSQGNEVQYFGMEHEGRIVSNAVDAYTTDMDFHGGSKLLKLTYPIKTIYSIEARRKIRKVLDDFQPDVCHLNNFNFQLTPSIILEILKWRKRSNKKCKIIYTAHDYQLLCPNHLCRNSIKNENCEKCLSGNFVDCIKGKCIHGSLAKSIVGAAEAYFWKFSGVYKHIDKIICCSEFMKSKMDSNPIFSSKTVAIHNFADISKKNIVNKKEYVLYFGRYSEEKGVKTLIDVCKKLLHINFVFVGSGPLENELNNIPNIKNLGFLNGEALQNVIHEALLTVCPSECYENCPFSVMESLMYGTPVLGANIGGIPELIKDGVTGELFESGNADELEKKIFSLWIDRERLNKYTGNCKEVCFDSACEYCQKLNEIYN